MSRSDRQTTFSLGVEQYRMSRLQVFNWGTFSDLHDIPISARGFLFVGRSGAGKSTLLDAFSALLVPPRWVDFNAAAREAERSGRDRNLVTYIRGAWAEQKDDDSGEIATRYLRSGTTWSALALSYQSDSGAIVVLVRVFWLRGNSNAPSDVRDHYLIFERPFDLRELDDFKQSNFDVRKLKHSFADAFCHEQFRPYCERFCHLLGIENEMALRLLHKTQSAKNLGDLNVFLRDFMLDRPETFAVADRLVAEFGELNAAHQAVVMARQQIETLAPARTRHEEAMQLAAQRARIEALRDGLDRYRDERRLELVTEYIGTLRVELAALDGERARQQEALGHQTALLHDLEREHQDLGGSQISRWEAEQAQLAIQRDERLRRRAQAQAACGALGVSLPDSPQGFAELGGRVRDELENGQQQGRADREAQFALAAQAHDAEAEFAATRKEVEALLRQPSNIPADMLELRASIAAALGIAEDALPFVGELLEVRPEEAAWQGAIERVLRGFALSVLVDEAHYAALVQHLNATHLGKRLIYHRAGRNEARSGKRPDLASLAGKLDVKDGPWTSWVRTELGERFDYACVDSLAAFRAADRAVTHEGQIKHGKSRHEKDDRRAVNDRRNWVLGFDNRAKRTVFEHQAQDLAGRITDLKERLQTLHARDQERAARALHCQTLINLQWSEIDAAPLLDRIATLGHEIERARTGNQALQELSARIDGQRGRVRIMQEALTQAEGQRISTRGAIEKACREQEALARTRETGRLTPDQRQGLDARVDALATPVGLENIDQLATKVLMGLGDELKVLDADIARCQHFVVDRFADFIRSWPAESEGLDATGAAAGDFFAKLARLETDGLPDHEERFFELLQTQSHQNLAALSTYINDGRKAILERMELVNESLSQVAFNRNGAQETFLRIDATDRQLPEVREFRQDIQQALSHAWSHDREFSESRFVALRRIVDRLASAESAERRWRDLVLDVRQHVEFIGREIDGAGQQVEIYRSGAGKSGGQRQKLATTCLAAALRYQLGGSDHGAPVYAPVVLDEAFDKADNEFTALAMNIFANFGFQMIVATPLKSVMTLEPFIGGACFVDISDRRVSGVLMIEYDTDRQRLLLPELATREATLEAS